MGHRLADGRSLLATYRKARRFAATPTPANDVSRPLFRASHDDAAAFDAAAASARPERERDADRERDDAAARLSACL